MTVAPVTCRPANFGVLQPPVTAITLLFPELGFPAQSEMTHGGGSLMSSESLNVEKERETDGSEPLALHLSKVRGTNLRIRARLKCHGITNSRQLLQAAGNSRSRAALIAKTGIDRATLAYIIKRADLARVKGIGATFSDMLEVVGIDTVAGLASWEPAALHRMLHDFNRTERFARRAPTMDEANIWVEQARKLPEAIDHI